MGAPEGAGQNRRDGALVVIRSKRVKPTHADAPSPRLRVALVAGTLAQGGAEKQLVYIAEALRSSGVAVRVFSLTRGEFHEPALRALGVETTWIGRYANPVSRSVALAWALLRFRPHIVQATHFFANLYAALVAPLFGAISVGAVRNDLTHEMSANGRWRRWLLHSPSALIMNSEAARRNAIALGVHPKKLHVLSNAIDLHSFDEHASAGESWRSSGHPPVVIGVGTLDRRKRFDRFLRALATARSKGAPITGVLVGDGPERASLEALASELDLDGCAIRFLGRRSDSPALLRAADMYLLTSEHEGCPNVVLEAMAARLPVVTSPAGDAGVIVEDGVSGFVVSGDDIETMASRLIELAESPALRARFGMAGRRRVEEEYSFDVLAQRVRAVHRAIAEQLDHRATLHLLSG